MPPKRQRDATARLFELVRTTPTTPEALVEAYTIIVDRGDAHVDATERPGGNTPLMEACSHAEREPMALMLLEKCGANVLVRNGRSQCVFYVAVRRMSPTFMGKLWNLYETHKFVVGFEVEDVVHAVARDRTAAEQTELFRVLSTYFDLHLPRDYGDMSSLYTLLAGYHHWDGIRALLAFSATLNGRRWINTAAISAALHAMAPVDVISSMQATASYVHHEYEICGSWAPDYYSLVTRIPTLKLRRWRIDWGKRPLTDPLRDPL